MGQPVQAVPGWAVNALQGITFWIGHRRALYSGYPLAEGAIVAELCNLIQSHLPREKVLQCEVQYTELLNDQVMPQVLTDRARADLVISARTNAGREGAVPEIVIEVKRASAPRQQVDWDLRRLSEVRRCHPGLRAFLIVVGEATLPKRFVTEKGVALRGRCDIPDDAGTFKIRRVCKAAHAFREKGRAQYACLIEVFPHLTD